MTAEARSADAIVNALTIDVEDYFQVSAFAPYIRRSEWESMPCRVEQNIDRILTLLSDTDNPVILARGGHGHGHAHGHRGGRGHHYGWSRGRHRGWR